MKKSTRLLWAGFLFTGLTLAASLEASDERKTPAGDGETVPPRTSEATSTQSPPLGNLAKGPALAVTKAKWFGETPGALRDLPELPVASGMGQRDEQPFILPKVLNGKPALDLAVQRVMAPMAMPAATTFAGDGEPGACGCTPPDTNGDVGTTYYVQTVNTRIGVYNKATGAAAVGFPKNINTIWSGMAGSNCASTNDGDPIVLYDRQADRWLLSQFSISGTSYDQCVAVSKTGDPTGAWWTWDFVWPGGNMNDYPHFGVWPDGYYMTVHEFTPPVPPGTWAGQGVAVFERPVMTTCATAAACSAARALAFHLYSANAPCSNNYGGMLASDWKGATPPPAGAPNYFVEADAAAELCAGDPASLKIFRFHVDWTTTSNSYFGTGAPGFAGGPNNTLAITAFTRLCPGNTACVPEGGAPARTLDGLGDRLMYRVDYRNFGTYDAVVLNHTADSGGGVAGIRWYEVQNLAVGAGPNLIQQSTYNNAADGIWRWAGSAAMDKNHNIALGFSAGSATLFPSIYYAGRLSTDPLNNLSQGEASMFTGLGRQNSTGHRWGDYSMLSVDPSDDCTFWYTNEYYAATSTATWSTRIGSFKFPSCVACAPPAVPTISSVTATAPNQITVTWGAVAGAATYNVYRSTGACPGGTFTLLGSTTAPTVTYVDNTATGGLAYSYKVTSYATCESAQSTCLGATAYGNCTAAPTFAGLTSATVGGSGTCSINLAWSAGSSNCGNSVTYNVYRSTVSGFSPGVANRIATGVSGTSYSDSGALAASTIYYYVVRAVDSGTGTEDTNTVGNATGTTTPAVCATGAPDVQAFTATTTGNAGASTGVNFLQWWNPASGPAGLTVSVNFRTDAFPVSPTDPLATAIGACAKAVTLGAVDSCTHSVLTNTTTYYYALWVRN